MAVGEQVVVAPGPWARRFWKMLGLPDTIDVRTPSGDVVPGQPMWTYWNLQEGEVAIDPLLFAKADGGAPPVIHLDTDAPLYTDDGTLVPPSSGASTSSGRHGVQGGDVTARRRRRLRARPVPVDDRRRPVLPGHVVRSALALAGALEGCRPLYKDARSGGVGASTVDNFPVFDFFRPNLYAILDSNHGYKMIGVGGRSQPSSSASTRASSTCSGFERFVTGDLHPVSSSPHPWA